MADERSESADERSVVSVLSGDSRGGGQAFEAGAVAQDRETGRFASGHSLTQRQKAFIRVYSENGGNGIAAAKEAGYACPQQSSWDLLRNPVVVAEVRRHMAARVMAEGTVVGVVTLIDVARDRGQSGAARTTAATRLVEMGGFLPRYGQGGAAREAEQKAPSEMSVAELDQVASALAEAMTRAKIAAAGGDPAGVALDVARNGDAGDTEA